jgi:hypothetical protein
VICDCNSTNIAIYIRETACTLLYFSTEPHKGQRRSNRMLFKGCTRCRGDLYREEDVGHTDLVCLQCGFRMPSEAQSSFRVVARRVDRSRASRTRIRAAA